MIVKDESHLIQETLELLCDKINFDYWVICDTGSSDNTPEIITSVFRSRGIPGELHHNKWKNFAHNRTLALEYAYNKTDLLIIFDADDGLAGTFVTPDEVLFDEYRFRFGHSSSSGWFRTQMINNRKRFKFVSVLHECISCQDPIVRVTTVHGDYHVVPGCRGNRSKNPNKYLDDALLLEKAYEEAVQEGDGIYCRYAFYCANSYRDACKFEKAIEWYKKTLTLNNWIQEKYVCCSSLYFCYEKLGLKESGFYYLVESIKYDDERVDCLYTLLVHYCNADQPKIAYSYFTLVKNLFDRIHRNDPTLNLDDKLFNYLDNYYFYVPYFMIIICDRVKDYRTGIQMYEIIFDRKIEVFCDFHIRNLLHNLLFYLTHIESLGLMSSFVPKMNSYMAFLKKNKYVSIGNESVLERFQPYGIKTEYILPSICKRYPKFSKEECTNTQNILIFTGFAHTTWNYSYTHTNPVGGSENAVIYISDALARKGYNVYVCGNVLDEITPSGVKYVHMDRLSTDIPYHTVILSRYLFFLEKYPTVSFGKLVVWAHDKNLLQWGTQFDKSEDIIDIWDKYIDKCVCLSEWQREKYISTYPQLTNRIHIINNGIPLEQVRGENMLVKQTHKFIYTSCSERGLDILLGLWPQILREWPDAELVISSYDTFPKSPEDEEMLKIIKKYPDSSHHLGKLSSTDLYEHIRSAEYWLYPCTFYETSCITAMEMLAGEVICLYYPLGGLTTTMGGCGIQISRGNELQTLFSLTEDQKINIRKRGAEYISTCTWERRVNDWIVDIIL
jgi:glycosyltransferase involved in cell wall biosynthesis